MPNLFDIQTRNQVFIERLKTEEASKVDPYLAAIVRYIVARLNDEGDTIETKKRLNILLSDIKAYQVDQYTLFGDLLFADLEELVLDQAEFEVSALNSVIVNIESDSPKPAAALLALRGNPLSVENYSGNLLIQPFIKEWSETNIKAVQNEIIQGYSQGRTVAQITKAIRGTKANNYKDGIIPGQSRRAMQNMVHTSIQHASSQGRLATWQANDDILTGYEWVSTLDSHTSRICRSLDGQVFKTGKGPLPPIHIACRSTTIPKVDKRYSIFGDDAGTRPSVGAGGAKKVEGNQTYYGWLKTQPVAFQNSAIGPQRANLLRNGGLTSDEFAALSLNKNFEPLTLKEMKRLRPEVFEEAGL